MQMMRAFLFATALTLVATFALADDHVIRPQCWEENVNGEIHRHCEVHRDVPGKSASVPAPEPSQSAVSSLSAPAVAAPPYYDPSSAFARHYYGYDLPHPPGYQSTLPPRYWPGYRPPALVFRFGPFSIWVP
jgi:hypothetical protein